MDGVRWTRIFSSLCFFIQPSTPSVLNEVQSGMAWVLCKTVQVLCFVVQWYFLGVRLLSARYASRHDAPGLMSFQSVISLNSFGLAKIITVIGRQQATGVWCVFGCDSSFAVCHWFYDPITEVNPKLSVSNQLIKARDCGWDEKVFFRIKLKKKHNNNLKKAWPVYMEQNWSQPGLVPLNRCTTPALQEAWLFHNVIHRIGFT